eukprot:Sspe_Gene.14876::Locus_5164_Transcript_2_4_Confidence_0.333_Length_3336::g.14876::m.14876/K00472/P4HA; prolyl 4-hydroxylase
MARILQAWVLVILYIAHLPLVVWLASPRSRPLRTPATPSEDVTALRNDRDRLLREVTALRGKLGVCDDKVVYLQSLVHECREHSGGGTKVTEAPFELIEGIHYLADFDVHAVRQPTPRYPPHPRFKYPQEQSSAMPAKLISVRPVAYYLPHVLDTSQCEAIIAAAKGKMERSAVVPHRGSNDSAVSNIRTSTSGWLGPEVPAVRDLIDRMTSLTGLPQDAWEPLQVLRYLPGQRYEAHHDYFDPMFYGDTGSNRAVTLLAFLNDVPRGGETVWPRAGGKPPITDYKTCSQGLRVIPKKGAGALFYGLHPDGSLDEYSLHGGCPVEEGEKWVVALWGRTPTR